MKNNYSRCFQGPDITWNMIELKKWIKKFGIKKSILELQNTGKKHFNTEHLKEILKEAQNYEPKR